MAALQHFILACLAFQLVAKSKASPTSLPTGTGQCGTYRKMARQIGRCFETLFRYAEQPSEKDRIRMACDQMPDLISCIKEALTSCNQKITELISEHIAANNQSLCSPNGWVHKYVVPLLPEFEDIRHSGCFHLIDSSPCKPFIFGWSRISKSTTVPEAQEMKRHNADIVFRCLNLILPKQIKVGPTCRFTWQEIFIFATYSYIKPMSMERRLYPEYIEQLENMHTVGKEDNNWIRELTNQWSA